MCSDLGALQDIMIEPPFYLDAELCKSLEAIGPDITNGIRRTIRPLQRSQETPPEKDYLPGEPRIKLENDTIGTDLEEELVTNDLDQLSPHLWLVAKQDSAHISSLTHQIVRGRRIIITEKPELHLVWYYNQVFIKPLPKYLLSYAFWKYYLISPHSPIQEPLQSSLRKAALGFLRSYSYLIQRRSDFNLAMNEDHRLLPKNIKYSSFSRLITSVQSIGDDMVSPRYHYGELRLSRLNFWIKIFFFRFTYHKAEGQYGPYFARFYGPILFLFGLFSVLLSAMQVVLAAMPPTENSSASWLNFPLVSRGFSIFTLLVVAVITCYFLLAFVGLASREIIFALRDLYRKRRRAA
ncbi:hypothetical protein F4813DRAFT_261701 [Daldinia decipiens]|uniref:uncharacterized protein n=1 Tax=Daldinia decipiens TaxID=326647 RepID=UPI0020C51C5E|nr:uncharacterized protein F4813DRAFT_261701 [Daldinia decipiens]KAI1660709.1 hypothetical protein F4813DRAFT_261701 [Daldinia decipiens]